MGFPARPKGSRERTAVGTPGGFSLDWRPWPQALNPCGRLRRGGEGRGWVSRPGHRGVEEEGNRGLCRRGLLSFPGALGHSRRASLGPPPQGVKAAGGFPAPGTGGLREGEPGPLLQGVRGRENLGPGPRGVGGLGGFQEGHHLGWAVCGGARQQALVSKSPAAWEGTDCGAWARPAAVGVRQTTRPGRSTGVRGGGGLRGGCARGLPRPATQVHGGRVRLQTRRSHPTSLVTPAPAGVTLARCVLRHHRGVNPSEHSHPDPRGESRGEPPTSAPGVKVAEDLSPIGNGRHRTPALGLTGQSRTGGEGQRSLLPPPPLGSGREGACGFHPLWCPGGDCKDKGVTPRG
ncbi:hypothetical protein SUDANB121_05061 [Nocardiopsis dassonvillei]